MYRIFQKTSGVPHSVARWMLVFGAVLAAGCGPSQEDLIRQAAMRRRPPADDDEGEVETDAVSVPAPTSSNTAANALDQISTTDEELEALLASESSNSQPEMEPAESLGNDSQPQSEFSKPTPQSIVERRNDPEYRNRAIEQSVVSSLMNVAAALDRYQKATNLKLPQRVVRSSQGLEVLSWRVELLPYLGYHDLYKRFDLDKAWNLPPNAELLQLIPDEFVAPHRPDAKTNLLAVSNNAGLYRSGGDWKNDEEYGDGPANSLLLVEVNDDYAKPWTAPQDYNLPATSFGGGLGELHSGGTFAMWGNLLPTLIPKNTNDSKFFKAASSSDGDTTIASQIHHSVAAFIKTDDLLMEEDVASVRTNPPNASASNTVTEVEPQVGLAPRDPKPSEESYNLAKNFLQKVYGERLRSANNDRDQSKLSEELLRLAFNSNERSANQFVLAEASRQLAIAAKNPILALRASDVLVAQYEVDAKVLLKEVFFAIDDGREMRYTANQNYDDVIERSVLIAYQCVGADEYEDAGRVIRYASRLAADGDRDFRLELTRTVSHLNAASRQFEAAKPALGDYAFGDRNPDVAYRVGVFFCFVKGDWNVGLPILSDANNERITTLAKTDLAGASDVQSMVSIGDSWKELARIAKQKTYRDGAHNRALHWYEAALEQTPGTLATTYLKSEIASVSAGDPGTVIEAFDRLADRLRIDLNQDLVLASQKGGPSGTTSDVEDDRDSG